MLPCMTEQSPQSETPDPLTTRSPLPGPMPFGAMLEKSYLDMAGINALSKMDFSSLFPAREGVLKLFNDQQLSKGLLATLNTSLPTLANAASVMKLTGAPALNAITALLDTQLAPMSKGIADAIKLANTSGLVSSPVLEALKAAEATREKAEEEVDNVEDLDAELEAFFEEQPEIEQQVSSLPLVLDLQDPVIRERIVKAVKFIVWLAAFALTLGDLATAGVCFTILSGFGITVKGAGDKAGDATRRALDRLAPPREEEIEG